MFICIYCRVNSNGRKIARSDTHNSQAKRCNDWLAKYGLKSSKRFCDDGEFIAPCYLPAFRSLIEKLRHSKEYPKIILIDHIGRLGKTEEYRRNAIELLTDQHAILIDIHRPSQEGLFYMDILKEKEEIK